MHNWHHGVGELLRLAMQHLSCDDARLESELLLAQVLCKSRAWLYAHQDACLTSLQQQAFIKLLQARARGEPMAYLIGQREFWSLTLSVTPDVLIPRHDTECLVTLALSHIPVQTEWMIADLGTGTGAIALALAKERPQANIVATDVSEAALVVAKANAHQLGLSNIQFAQGDWYAALGQQHFDLIVSNPPYIATDDPHLEAGDLCFEPHLALVSGTDGLDAIRKLVSCAPDYLKPQGWFLVEHGWQQAAQARHLLHEVGFSHIMTHQDLEGRDRVTGGCFLP